MFNYAWWWGMNPGTLQVNMFILSLVFIFLLRIRFPATRPISSQITTRYDVMALRCFRYLERWTSKLDKCRRELTYLETCRAYETIPKYLRSKFTKKLFSTKKSKIMFYWKWSRFKKVDYTLANETILEDYESHPLPPEERRQNILNYIIYTV